MKCGKALFALRTSIIKDYIQHVHHLDSPKQVCETLERLFTQKNTMRLQVLENKLARMVQGNLSISKYFVKVKIYAIKYQSWMRRSLLVSHAYDAISFMVWGKSSCYSYHLYKGGQIIHPSLIWRISFRIKMLWWNRCPTIHNLKKITFFILEIM